eukprot:2942342-Alexandrium_andersonii.AAC.1
MWHARTAPCNACCWLCQRAPPFGDGAHLPLLLAQSWPRGARTSSVAERKHNENASTTADPR